MNGDPRHDIRKAMDTVLRLASQVNPNGVDAAIADIPGAWDVTSIVSQRHGYDYIAVIEAGVVGYQPATGKGHSIAVAIREASKAATLQMGNAGGQYERELDKPGHVTGEYAADIP